MTWTQTPKLLVWNYNWPSACTPHYVWSDMHLASYNSLQVVWGFEFLVVVVPDSYTNDTDYVYKWWVGIMYLWWRVARSGTPQSAGGWTLLWPGWMCWCSTRGHRRGPPQIAQGLWLILEHIWHIYKLPAASPSFAWVRITQVGQQAIASLLCSPFLFQVNVSLSFWPSISMSSRIGTNTCFCEEFSNMAVMSVSSKHRGNVLICKRWYGSRIVCYFDLLTGLKPF